MRCSGIMSERRTPGTPEDVLDDIEDGADLIVPLANGEPVSVLDAIEAERRPVPRRARPPDARAPRPALPARRDARPPAARVVLPLAGDAAGVPRARLRAGPEPLQRGAAAAAGDDEVLDGPRRGRADGSARLLLARHQLRLRRAVHRERALLPRGQRPHAAHVRAKPAPRQPGGGLDRGRSAPRRGPADRNPTDIDARIAALVVERIPNGATIQAGIGSIPNALLAGLARPPRPRRAHRAALRRIDATSSTRVSSPVPASG